MLIDKNQVKKSFNSAASTYDSNCSVQIHSGAQLTALLKKTKPEADTILDLGCGTGNITYLLSEKITSKNIYGIDISQSSITKAQQKYNLDFLVKDFDNLSINSDIIFANLSLHWSPDLTNTLKKLKEQLKSNGIIAFSIPTQGTFNEIKNSCAIHDFFAASAVEKTLAKLKYSNIVSKTETITKNFSCFRDALLSLKKTGTNYTPKSNSGLSTKIKSYLKSNTPFSLSYNISYFLAEI